MNIPICVFLFLLFAYICKSDLGLGFFTEIQKEHESKPTKPAQRETILLALAIMLAYVQSSASETETIISAFEKLLQ